MITQEAPQRSLESQQTSFAPFTGSTPSRTVLFVEDDDDLREVMSLILQGNGYKVIAFDNAHEASARFRDESGRVDVLLTDIEMPGRSGIELARELTGLRPSLPVLIVSGSWITTEIAQEFQSRGWKHLSKPARLPVVLTTLELLLRSEM